ECGGVAPLWVWSALTPKHQTAPIGFRPSDFFRPSTFGLRISLAPGNVHLLVIALALELGAGISPVHAAATSDTTIWFNEPAAGFGESCPLGNGRLGAMWFGGVDEDRIVFNENSVWSGSRQQADRAGASAALPQIRRLLLEGKNVEAEKLVNAHFTCQGPGSGNGEGAKVQYGTYQVLGNLHLSFRFSNTDGPVTEYHRELDLTDAVA